MCESSHPSRASAKAHRSHNARDMAGKRKYTSTRAPSAPVEVKAVCTLLVCPDGRVLLEQNGDGDWSDPGGRITDGENIADAAARIFLKETGTSLPSVTSRYVGRAYQRWSKAAVLVYECRDTAVTAAFTFRDVSSLRNPPGEKYRTFSDGTRPVFRTDHCLKAARALLRLAHALGPAKIFV